MWLFFLTNGDMQLLSRCRGTKTTMTSNTGTRSQAVIDFLLCATAEICFMQLLMEWIQEHLS